MYLINNIFYNNLNKMDDIPLTVEEQLIKLRTIVFQNMEDSMDTVEVHFVDNKFDFYNPKEFNISFTNIVKKPNKNKLLRKYLIEANDDEKFVFTLQVYNNSCMCSKSKKYICEILLNTNPDYLNGYELHIYEKVKHGIYRTEYVLINIYLSK